jgi:hypothetical protein
VEEIMSEGELLKRFINKVADLSFPDNSIMGSLLRGDFKDASHVGGSTYYDIWGKVEPDWVTAYLDSDDPKKGREMAFELFIADFLIGEEFA